MLASLILSYSDFSICGIFIGSGGLKVVNISLHILVHRVVIFTLELSLGLGPFFLPENSFSSSLAWDYDHALGEVVCVPQFRSHQGAGHHKVLHIRVYPEHLLEAQLHLGIPPDEPENIGNLVIFCMVIAKYSQLITWNWFGTSGSCDRTSM